MCRCGNWRGVFKTPRRSTRGSTAPFTDTSPSPFLPSSLPPFLPFSHRVRAPADLCHLLCPSYFGNDAMHPVLRQSGTPLVHRHSARLPLPFSPFPDYGCRQVWPECLVVHNHGSHAAHAEARALENPACMRPDLASCSLVQVSWCHTRSL